MSRYTNFAKHTQSKGIRKMLINRFNQRFIEKLGCLIPPSGNVKLFDVGCGEGFMLNLVNQQYPNVELYGCDINESAVNFAKQQVPKADLFVCDGSNINVPSHSFDVIVCTEVLEHVLEPEKILAEIKRVLKPGGSVLLSVPHEPFFMLGNLVSGRHIKTFGNHPEHVVHFSMRKLRKICNVYFEKMLITSVFPWIMVTTHLYKSQEKDDNI